ncbi:MAG TPA: DapH/DapD/GlmU-related protein [Candidatus Eisenbacteria bacterium]|nr:DapH/DapD/GlmU-related protein [Candidatus Eisenbacteria bacterium]
MNKYIVIGIVAVALISAFVIGHNFGTVAQTGTTPQTVTPQNTTQPSPNIHQNVETAFNPEVKAPQIDNSAFIHPFAVVIGDCEIGKRVFMGPMAVCRGDEGTPIYIGDDSNVQDGVILHALETTIDGSNIDGRRFSESGDRLMANDSRFDQGYAVFIGNRVSLAHGSMIHGPAWIGNDTFIGMKSLVFNAKVGNNVAIGVSSTITGGVTIPDNSFVPPGSVIDTQQQADSLPSRIGSAYESINKAVIHVNQDLAAAYNQGDVQKIRYYKEILMEEEELITQQPSP